MDREEGHGPHDLKNMPVVKRGKKNPTTKKQLKVGGSDRPTPRGVMNLFRELESRGRRYNVTSQSKTKLDLLKKQRQELIEKLKTTPDYVKLTKQIEELERETANLHTRLFSALNKTRNRYFAHGLTPKIREEIQTLLDLYDKELPYPEKAAEYDDD